ncbi:MAG: hypothetical protein K2N87_10905 [Eubacterium sp.]|nr:hypothetical protein [Eubacterium sp.]
MRDLKEKTLNLEELLFEIGDYLEFSGENQNMELSEYDLELVSAARAVPDYREFLKKVQQGK